MIPAIPAPAFARSSLGSIQPSQGRGVIALPGLVSRWMSIRP